MGREQYLRELEARLSARVSPQELVGMMEYYEEYFDEQGPDQISEAIAELGSPAELVIRIMGDRVSRGPKAEVVDIGYKEPRCGLSTTWKVILGICAAPIVIPLIFGLVALVAGLLLGGLALSVGLVVGGVACVVFGAVSAVAGFVGIFAHGMASTMFFVGGGMLTSGIGILLTALGVGITGFCLRGTTHILGRFWHRRGEMA